METTKHTEDHMKTTDVTFWRIHPGQRKRAFSFFARVKEVVDSIGIGNGRYRMVLTGENTGLYYSLHDSDSMSGYGQALDHSFTSPELHAVMADLERADAPVAYVGNWVMHEAARFDESTGTEHAFIIRNWDVTPGREDDFLQSAEDVSAIMRRFGGVHVVYRIDFGGEMAGVYSSTIGFPDFASLYAFAEHSATSGEGKVIRQNFHKGTPPARSRSILTAVAVPIGDQPSASEQPDQEDVSIAGC
jgi:hypothetical protein